MYFTHKDVGDSHFDSDADLTTGMTDPLGLSLNQNMKFKDAGVLIRQQELPSELLYLEGSADSCLIQLEWATVQNQYGTLMLLESSSDGLNYEVLDSFELADSTGQVKTFQADQIVEINRPIYRVRIIDQTGQYVAVAVILIETECFFDRSNVKLYPNPTTHSITMEFIAGGPQTVEVRIMDLLGRYVGKIDVEVKNAQDKILLDLSRYPASSYIFLFEFEGKPYIKQIIKY
jgi:hypothetical protein